MGFPESKMPGAYKLFCLSEFNGLPLCEGKVKRENSSELDSSFRVGSLYYGLPFLKHLS